MISKKQIFDVIKTKDSICFSFSSTMGNIDEVCEQTTGYLRATIQDIEKQLFPINLVIREGLTNAVRHGNACDPAKLVKFMLTVKANATLSLMIE